jgi:hypothetical protein
MHNDIGRCRGVMMVARWEAEVEDIEVGGGNYCQIWVASIVEGSKAKFLKDLRAATGHFGAHFS